MHGSPELLGLLLLIAVIVYSHYRTWSSNRRYRRSIKAEADRDGDGGPWS
jgi:hypothetical protein